MIIKKIAINIIKENIKNFFILIRNGSIIYIKFIIYIVTKF